MRKQYFLLLLSPFLSTHSLLAEEKVNADEAWSKPSGGLAGRIRLLKDRITKQQYLAVTLEIKNVGAHPVWLGIGNPFLVQAEIHDASGKPVPVTAKRVDVIYSPNLRSAPRTAERQGQEEPEGLSAIHEVQVRIDRLLAGPWTTATAPAGRGDAFRRGGSSLDWGAGAHYSVSPRRPLHEPRGPGLTRGRGGLAPRLALPAAPRAQRPRAGPLTVSGGVGVQGRDRAALSTEDDGLQRGHPQRSRL